MPSHISAARRMPVAALVSVAALTGIGLLAPGNAAAATSHGTPAALRAAAVRSTHADRAFVASAHALKRCQRVHPRHCASQRHALQQAGVQLDRLQHNLARLGRGSGTTALARTAATVSAPKLTVANQTLGWSAVSGAKSYVFVRKVPGLADQYSLVNGTSTTPAAVTGKTVHYSVRANLSGGAWASPEASIAYAVAAPPVDTKAAPAVTVSNGSLSWKAIGSVSSYILVAKTPGQADAYSVVSGTSTTPPAVAGSTVSYSVRTDVDGSAWSAPVSIAFAASAPDPTPTPTPTPGAFSMGVVSGSALSYELPFIKQAGAHTARLEFSASTSASSMATVMDQYARAGIRPLLLAGISGTSTTAQAQNLATWAAAYGPGGTFWQGKNYPANTAVTTIEFGNETSYTYQFSDNSTSAYAARAQSYALHAKDAAVAITAANPKVGLLAQGDNAQQGSAWVQNMFKAVPNLGNLVAGWTIHPYGPNWASRIDSTISSTKAAGSPDLPIFVTEWGLSTDGGRCLDDNYGWDKCMSYANAASTLHTVLTGMQSRYGNRLGAFYLYQVNDLYPSGTQGGREAYFGALQNNGSAKGAYTNEVEADLAAH